MAYNLFLQSSAGEGLFYLMFECDPFIPTLFKLLLPELRYMGDGKCWIHLDTMWEIHMMAVLNLKMARDKCPPPIRDPDKTDFKIGDMVLMKTIPSRTLLIQNINPVLEFARKFWQDLQCTPQTTCWPIYLI